MRSAPGYFLWKQVGLALKICGTVAATEALFLGQLVLLFLRQGLLTQRPVTVGCPACLSLFWVPFPSCEVSLIHTY